jgi:hypothetical protein
MSFYGSIQTIQELTPGSDYGNGQGISTSGGDGPQDGNFNCTVDITSLSGQVQKISLRNPGLQYKPGNVLYVKTGNGDCSFRVLSVTQFNFTNQSGPEGRGQIIAPGSVPSDQRYAFSILDVGSRVNSAHLGSKTTISVFRTSVQEIDLPSFGTLLDLGEASAVTYVINGSGIGDFDLWLPNSTTKSLYGCKVHILNSTNITLNATTNTAPEPILPGRGAEFICLGQNTQKESQWRVVSKS